MQENTLRLPGRSMASHLKRAHLLLLIVIGAVALAVPMSAQSFTTANTITGNILGTVVDTSDDPIPGANVILQGPAGNRLTAITKDDGGFAFDQTPAGVAYQITVTAEGFADWNSSITVEPGENKTLPEIKLRILAVQRAVTVSYSSKEVATQQLKAEEQQRILSFIPNTYVVYEPQPRATYGEDEVPHGIQKPHQSVLLRTHGCVGWRPTGSRQSERMASRCRRI